MNLSNSPLSHDWLSGSRLAVRSHSKYSSNSTLSPRKETEVVAHVSAVPNPITT